MNVSEQEAYAQGYTDYLKDPNGRHCSPADEPEHTHYGNGWYAAKRDKEKGMSVDWTKPIQTRDGLKARVLATDLKGGRESIAVAVTYREGGEYLQAAYADGTITDRVQTRWDIINVPREPVKKSAWFNIYPDNYACYYPTKEEADRAHSDDRVICVFVEWEVA